MITAIQDRLTFTILDAKQYTGLQALYTNVTAKVNTVTASTEYKVRIDYPTNAEVSYTSGVSPTALTIAAGLKAALDTAAIAGLTVTDNADGSYTVSSATAFIFWIDERQDIKPDSYEDMTISAMIDTAKVMADTYCNNNFYESDIDGNLIDSSGDLVTDKDDAALADIPGPVKFGVGTLLKHLYQEFNATSGIIKGGAVKSLKVGKESITFASPLDYGDWWGAAAGLAMMARNALSPYRITLFYWGKEDVGLSTWRENQAVNTSSWNT